MSGPGTMNVCIVGVGARTALGLTAASSAAAVRAGITRIAEHPYMVDAKGEPFMVAMDSTLEGATRRDRMVGLALGALDDVLPSIPHARTMPLSIMIGLPEASESLSTAELSRVCQRIGSALLDRCQPQITAVAEGQAAVVVALQRAVEAITARRLECCIVGGVDSWIDPDLLEGLDARGRSLGNRWGFAPGEGAAMLAVCSATFARQARLRPLAWIASVVTTHEPNRMHTETICVGEALGLALREAAGQAGTRVTKQFCDIDGDRYREHEFSFAILRVPATAFVDAVDYVAPATNWGNTGAATGGLLTILPIMHHQRGHSSGAWPMVWCGSENGRRGALVLHLEPTAA